MKGGCHLGKFLNETIARYLQPTLFWRFPWSFLFFENIKRASRKEKRGTSVVPTRRFSNKILLFFLHHRLLAFIVYCFLFCFVYPSQILHIIA